MEQLRYYIAHNAGLQVIKAAITSRDIVGEFFEGRTVDHLIGRNDKPEVVFAAVDYDGGYRTVDGGKTWQKVLDADVRQFAIDPHDQDVIYAGAEPVRLFRSEDGGTTWEPLDGLLALPDEVKAKWGAPPHPKHKEGHVRHIFIHPDDANFLFVSLEHGGVLLSRDRGRTFEDRSDGIAYHDMHVLENLPGSKERFFVSSARGFYHSDDAGAHWYRSEKGMPWAGDPVMCYSHDFLILPANGSKPKRMVMAGARGSPGVWFMEKTTPKGHIMLSDDYGDSWRLANGGMPTEAPAFPWVLLRHPTDPKQLYCGTGNGSKGFGMMPDQRGTGTWYRSQDAGETWSVVVAETPSTLSGWIAVD